MRSVVLLAAFTLALALPEAALAAETEEITLTAEGMYCTNCEDRVESALAGLEGVESVSADHQSQTADVVYNPDTVTPEEMAATIDDQTAYVGRLPGEDGADDGDASTAESGSTGDDGSGDGKSDDEVAQADFAEQPASATGDTGLPTGALIAGAGAVALLVLAGGGWLVVRR
jgi:copper chaperone CopZ